MPEPNSCLLACFDFKPRGPENWTMLEVYNFSIDDEIGRRYIYQNVQLFIKSRLKSVLNVAIFKYSLHKFKQNIQH